MEWAQQFEIIKKEISLLLEKQGKKYSDQNAADYLQINIGKIRAWKKGQRPTADDLELLARELSFSPSWLLLGSGSPLMEKSSMKHIPEYVAIGDTLRELVGILPGSYSQIAKIGDIGNDELTSYINCYDIPSCLTVARWIHAFHINANFLLAQVGQPFLTDNEYNEKGPLDSLREARGDFDDSIRERFSIPLEEISEKLTESQREMLTYKRLQTELGMDKQRIAEGIEAIVMGKRLEAKKSDTEPGFDEGVGFSERDGDGFGG